VWLEADLRNASTLPNSHRTLEIRKGILNPMKKRFGILQHLGVHTWYSNFPGCNKTRLQEL
jgi:hypothetical protein